MRLVFIDRNEALCSLIEKQAKENGVHLRVMNQDLLHLEGASYVAPGNSFGFMDGGADLAINRMFDCEDDIREFVENRGEIPVGSCERFGNVLYSPTMRVPMVLPENSVNAYLATLAAVRAAQKHGIYDVIFVGMCSGIGGMRDSVVAKQMVEGMKNGLTGNHRPNSWAAASVMHQMLWKDRREDCFVNLQTGGRIRNDVLEI